MSFPLTRRPCPGRTPNPSSRPLLRRLLLLAGVIAVVVATLPAAAQEGAPPEMTPEQQAMMEAWTKAMQPGEPHEKLAELAGEYEMTVKTWMDPNGEPEVTKGTARYEMIMGGRYLQETVEGNMMDQPFHGMGLTGYDNVKKKYWGAWVDNMSTGLTVGEGDYNADGVLEMHSTYNDPLTGDAKTVRTTTVHRDDGSMLFEWFEPAEGGELKTMEILYQPK